MGSMTRPASDSLTDILARLDDRVRRVDEERWLSSRYAKVSQRDALIVLYAFYYELARVRGAVSDPMLGQIRFQWWRDALEELQRGEVRQHDVVIALSDQIAAGALAWQPLRDLIEPFEGAFVASDRALEPEATLAVIAADVCAPGHGLDGLIGAVAPDWAALRRGEAATEHRKQSRVPSASRPALAHFRLRHAWSRGKSLGRVQMRFSILAAVLTGAI